MKLLAQRNIDDIFGTISPPPGPDAINTGPVGENVARLFGFAVNMVLIVAGLMTLIYTMWGALDFIKAGGDKEALSKARKKITYGFMGLFLLIAVFVGWIAVSTIVLGIIDTTGTDGIRFELPKL